MSYTKLATSANTVGEEIKAASGARRELLLEIYNQGWAVKNAGTLVNKMTGKTVLTMTLLEVLTSDSADANYIKLVSYLLRSGWKVLQNGYVECPGQCGPMPVHEALLACIGGISN